MIFYYALGGGLGHLTRALAVVHTLGIHEPVTLALSPNPHLETLYFNDLIFDNLHFDKPNSENPPIAPIITPVQVPSDYNGDAAAVGFWLQQQLDAQHWTSIIIDAFPAGLMGELSNVTFPANTRLIHLARLLRWSQYRARHPDKLPHFNCTHILEPLAQDHVTALANCSDAVSTLALCDPQLPASPPPSQQQPGHEQENFWLVVHAGNDDEIRQLLALAQDTAALESLTPEIRLIAPHRPDWLAADIVYQHAYPATAWFDKAQKIFSACGFNSARQLLPYRHKHVVLPFQRALDDQFTRAARLRALSSADPA